MAEIGLDIGPFQTGLNKTQQAANSAGSKIGSTLKGAFGAFFGYQAFQKTIGDTWRRMAQIKDLSDQFSITTEEVQKLSAAAGNVGMSFEDFGTALLRMNAAREDAAKGNAELEDSFARFGITFAELRNPAVQNIDLFKRVGQALSSINPGTKDLDALKDLFGRGGARMAAALKEIQNVKEPIISQEDIDKVDAMEESLKKLQRTAMAKIAGPVAKYSDVITSILEDGKSFLKEYSKIVANPFGLFAKPDTETQGLDTSPLPLGKSNKSVALGGPTAAERKRNAENDFSLREEQEKFEKKLFDFAFKQMSKREKLNTLQKESRDISEDISTVENAMGNGLVERAEGELRILELKGSQLEVLEKINDLQNKANADFTGLGKVTGVGSEMAALSSMSTGAASRGVLPTNMVQFADKTEKAMKVQTEVLQKILGELGMGKIKFSN